MNEKFASNLTLFFYPKKARKNLPQILTKKNSSLQASKKTKISSMIDKLTKDYYYKDQKNNNKKP